jgi:hypothetical protein
MGISVKRSVVALVVTAALALSAPAQGDALATRSDHGSSVTPGGTFIIGDSTTYRVSGLLRSEVPEWYLDYHWGRSIKALPSHIDRYLAKDPHPSNFVMALGTNWCHNPEWSEARLRRAIAKLPADTNVFLMMVVRAGAFQAEKDKIMRRYNHYSKDLARTRPHTYIVNWRKTVLDDPTLDPVRGTSALLEDGTHPTGSPHGDTSGPGTETFVRLILDKWAHVNDGPTV